MLCPRGTFGGELINIQLRRLVCSWPDCCFVRSLETAYRSGHSHYREQCSSGGRLHGKYHISPAFVTKSDLSAVLLPTTMNNWNRLDIAQRSQVSQGSPSTRQPSPASLPTRSAEGRRPVPRESVFLCRVALYHNASPCNSENVTCYDKCCASQSMSDYIRLKIIRFLNIKIKYAKKIQIIF